MDSSYRRRFWVLAAVTVGGALAVFASRNLLHAIVFLIVLEILLALGR